MAPQGSMGDLNHSASVIDTPCSVADRGRVDVTLTDPLSAPRHNLR